MVSIVKDNPTPGSRWSTRGQTYNEILAEDDRAAYGSRVELNGRLCRGACCGPVEWLPLVTR